MAARAPLLQVHVVEYSIQRLAAPELNRHYQPMPGSLLTQFLRLFLSENFLLRSARRAS